MTTAEESPEVIARVSRRRTRSSAGSGDGDITDALLEASRGLVAVSARSLGSAGTELTVPQFRLLVVLRAHEERNVTQLAVALDAYPSTVSRMCDRLLAKRLITRRVSSTSRRETSIRLTPAGRRLIDRVVQSRREQIARIVALIPPDDHQPLLAALRAFSEAAERVLGDTTALPWA